ncbi:DUF1403 family protein [Niveispirillum sp. SYP-B3756]|uniref:DUF1403 family protein n=1 Tax=Niveispirillum sp. SYP-B3756 TaxID=2662178 RepID=UPI0012922122|nr:DUF1403 family protein [Niveispirillum sp. SYP-B3756]MQP68145.1 DUF1403 family protein [Niveispirillum sp. SYP-B3756]
MQAILEESPGWMRAAAVQPLLRLGARLADLHQALAISPIAGLVADRASLMAAAKVLASAGRPETVPELRDMRMMGDPAGPGAPTLAAWSWLASLPWEESAASRYRSTHGDLQGMATDHRHHNRLFELIRGLGWRDTDEALLHLVLAVGTAAALPCPLAAIGTVLEATTGLPLSIRLLAGDYVVGRCLGWPLPLYSLGLGRREQPDPSVPAIARTLLAGTGEILSLVRPLASQAARLIDSGRQVRTRQAAGVITRILSRDAVWSAALADLLPDRPARRLLQRLVDLGAVRELTGRPSYRLYGL